ncbi:MAG: tRNA dihydrouridine synthase DusB [Bdellovibrionales bacterium]
MTESRLLAHLRENPFVLAPMAGITDRPFRSFMRSLGCGIVVSELVSATGLRFSSEKTRKLMEFDSDQHPVGIQLFGENLEHLAEAARVVEQMGADFVDLNFGCPVPKVVNKGAGSACLKDLVRLRDVIRATKSAVGVPLTIKIRTGWDQNSRNSDAVVQVAYDEGVTWVAIHGRTRAAAYTGLADWDYIREIKVKSPLPILGNGDIVSPELARTRLRTSLCDGVMIGRGCLKNPKIFLEARGLDSNLSLEAILSALLEQLESFYSERLVLIQMRKFAAWFSAGFPGAASFRKDLFQAENRVQVWTRIENFFRPLAGVCPRDTSHESFLMGGHG